MARICIPDYAGKHVVEGARALTRNGDTVILTTWNTGKIQSFFKSNCISELIKVTSPSVSALTFAEEVARLAESENFDAILPFGLNAVEALVQSPSRPRYNDQAMLPSVDVFNLLNNKDTLETFAREIGVSTPLTFKINDRAELKDIQSKAIYPLVLKVTNYSGVNGGLRYANNLPELEQAWDLLVEQASEKSANVIVQEFIPGKIHDVCSLSVSGRPVRMLTQVRELMYPIYGGVGAVNITTDDQELRRLAEKLIIESGYHGPAQIEFKRDSRTGEFKLIEFNPKLWGTLPLSITAGVSFPKLIRDYITGESLRYEKDYKVGLRYNFWMPLAILAKLQLIKEFGFGRKKWETPYTEAVNDIDFRDIKPDIHRALRTLVMIFKRKGIDVNSNLPKELIPTPWKNEEYEI